MHTKQLVLKWLIGAIWLFLSSCSLLPQKDQQNAKLAKLQHWEVRGKLSVRHHQQGITGYLNWQQNQQVFDLYVAGPLAQGATRIKGNAQQVSLQLATWQQAQTANSAEGLMQRHLGWSFPVVNLRYWIKGMVNPDAGVDKVKYDKVGLLESVQKDGWIIRLSRYQYQGGYWLPTHIKITGKHYRFVLAIKSWTLYD